MPAGLGFIVQAILGISECFEYVETYLLSNDTFDRGLIDTGAVRNVCLHTWIEEFMAK